MAKQVGTGTSSSIAFGTTAFEADFYLEDMQISGFQRPVIDTTSMETTGARTKIPGELYEPPTLVVTAQFNPDEPPPYDQAAETVTVSFEDPANQATNATMSGSAFISEVSISVPLEDKMMQTFTVQFTDDITFADASA